ncbi:hypothetical protein RIR_jg601.t1 [Rhizophagus irregularis DAOM 181602=DAOM 197198]|nr:hypothetical protein RIR_jg601.t1 [Rhizophagus irregularis DAOM 181602=DAOM 197198]
MRVNHSDTLPTKANCHSLTIAAKTLPTKSFNSLNEFDLSPLSPRVPPGIHKSKLRAVRKDLVDFGNDGQTHKRKGHRAALKEAFTAAKYHNDFIIFEGLVKSLNVMHKAVPGVLRRDQENQTFLHITMRMN